VLGVRPGVVRCLHAHERAQVAAALGLPPQAQALAAGVAVWGCIYTHQGWAWHYAARNRALYGHTVHTGRWQGRPVDLLVLRMPGSRDG